jgi:glycosyltransferase involved in cell wall biosynthesis
VITAVGVVVPVHNEQDRIVACLRSLREALQRLPPGITAAVTLVLDRCTDRTPDRVATMLADWPQGEVVLAPSILRGAQCAGEAPAGSGVGALRALGLRQALRRLQPNPPHQIWLLSTDADTTVPPDWACEHLRLAAAGAHGVAGLADLAGEAHLPPEVRRRYRALLTRGLHDWHHEHIYGANLGFRADAYLAVGGFPLDGAGEDHGLWRRLAAAGYCLHHPTSLRVKTSGRIHGRASGGLADLLHSLYPHPNSDQDSA